MYGRTVGRNDKAGQQREEGEVQTKENVVRGYT